MMRYKNLVLNSVLAFVLLVSVPAFAQQWHHVHLTVPDAQKGAEWYAKNLEGEKRGNRAARFGKTNINFFENKEAYAGNAGSSIDHIGFSFTNLEQKLEELKKAGAKILTEIRSPAPSIRFVYAEDPWGTKLEILEEKDRLGFHHVHHYLPDPEKGREWYAETFGGEKKMYLNIALAVDYGDVLLFFRQSLDKKKLADTIGRAVDHIGWIVEDIEAKAESLRKNGVKILTEPYAIRPNLKISYIEGPGGVRIELLQPIRR